MYTINEMQLVTRRASRPQALSGRRLSPRALHPPFARRGTSGIIYIYINYIIHKFICINCIICRIPFGDHPLKIGTIQRR